MKKYLVSFILFSNDILVLVAIFYLTLAVRSSIYTTYIANFSTLALKDFIFVIITISMLMFYEKIYTLRYDFWQDTKKVLKALTLAYFIVLAFLTILKTSLEYSRLFISLYFFFAFFMIPISKRFMKKLIYKFSFFKQNVFILGDQEQVSTFEKEFHDNWYIGMKYNKEKYDTVIIFSKGMHVDEVNKNIAKYLNKKSTVYMVPYVKDINFSNSEILEYSNIRYNTLQIENKLLLKSNIWIKNIFDFIAVLLIFPLFILIHLILSLLIRLDSKGSIFFKQYRLGKNNQSFVCYKYRSMHEDSELLLKNYLLSHRDEVEHYEKYHKYKNDPRITKIGKILRATSLDEVAQLINVLKGEMSLVGPRPYMVSESDKLGENLDFILKVKPGITGLWQVSGRNNLTFKERNDLEVWYIKNWSLWSDFIILIKTIKVVFLKA
ncbi:MAG: sugar transferase [Thiovulaceae bacterium]|nr:sugar transferase [Sulfurimonadaceae bacterium]